MYRRKRIYDSIEWCVKINEDNLDEPEVGVFKEDVGSPFPPNIPDGFYDLEGVVHSFPTEEEAWNWVDNNEPYINAVWERLEKYSKETGKERLMRQYDPYGGGRYSQ
jgi:hypothetical protein